MNGNSDMQNFLNLLYREETDFIDQVKKSKAFIQSVIRDKEELSSIVANQSNKISKLDGERMEYQKKLLSRRERSEISMTNWSKSGRAAFRPSRSWRNLRGTTRSCSKSRQLLPGREMMPCPGWVRG